mgnify:FL=1
MYKVTYYFCSSTAVAIKEFPNFKEASDFSLTLPTGDVIEIKYYESSDNNGPALRG